MARRVIVWVTLAVLFSLNGCKRDGSNPLLPSALHRDLLVSSDGVIALISDDGSNRRDWSPSLYVSQAPQPSPDGQYIAYYHPDSAFNMCVYVMKADGTQRTRLVPVAANGQYHFEDLRWTNDGKSMLFSSPLSGTQQVYRVESNGQNFKQVTSGEFAVSPIPSPTRGEFVYWGIAGWYVLDVDSAQSPRPIDPNKRSGNSCWSPDGSRIAYVQNALDTLSPDVYTISRDGSDPIALTHDHRSLPKDWSRDGTKILYAQLTQGFYHCLSVMNADGSAQTQLVDFGSEEIMYAHFSPDSKKIVVVVLSGDLLHKEIYTLNIDGSALIKVLNDTDSDAAWMPS